MGLTYHNDSSQSVLSGSPAAPGNLLEIQIFSPDLRPIESETLGVEPSNLCF